MGEISGLMGEISANRVSFRGYSTKKWGNGVNPINRIAPHPVNRTAHMGESKSWGKFGERNSKFLTLVCLNLNFRKNRSPG